MTTQAEQLLPAPLEHEFTPADFDAEDFEQIEPLLEKLVSMPVEKVEQLESYLEAWMELDAFVDEAGSRLQVEKARVTNDEERARRWERFVESIIPKMKDWEDRLGRKLLESPALGEFDAPRYASAMRVISNEVELFQEENVALHTRLDQLSTRYGEISGGWSVEFDGEERPMAAMQRYLMDSDREIRKKAWEACARRRAEDGQVLDELWQKMFELRQQVAQNAGFKDYRDYIFAEKLRDYDEGACFAFHELIEEEVLPLVKEVEERNRQKLGIDRIRPWDSSADPDGGEPLRPCDNAEELVDGVHRMMGRIDPEFGDQFQAISAHFDLEARAHKAQGGFMMFLHASRRPFIFANTAGVHADVLVLLHEAGHAFHYMRCAEEFPLSKSHIPTEFAEVASMAMELFHYQTLDEFYGEEDHRRAVKEHLRRILGLLAIVAAGDAFQHELYAGSDPGIEGRAKAWMAQLERFKPYVDYSGINEDWLHQEWHRILHFFIVPFYFIEYGFAQLGALQLAMNAEKDREQTMRKYKEAMAMGPGVSTAQLYEAAGVQFVPSREKVREMMAWIRGQLLETD